MSINKHSPGCGCCTTLPPGWPNPIPVRVNGLNAFANWNDSLSAWVVCYGSSPFNVAGCLTTTGSPVYCVFTPDFSVAGSEKCYLFMQSYLVAGCPANAPGCASVNNTISYTPGPITQFPNHGFVDMVNKRASFTPGADGYTISSPYSNYLNTWLNP